MVLRRVDGLCATTPHRPVRPFRPFRGRRTQRRDVAAELPELIELLVRSLRSGQSVPQALGEAAVRHTGRLGGPLVECHDALVAGVPLDEALERLRAGQTSTDLDMLAAVLGLSASSGGAVSQALVGLGHGVRDRLAVAEEIRALTSQATLSAMVLAALPVGFGLMTAGVDPGRLAFLFGDPTGRWCLAAGLCLELVGVAWMRNIIGRHR